MFSHLFPANPLLPILLADGQIEIAVLRIVGHSAELGQATVTDGDVFSGPQEYEIHEKKRDEDSDPPDPRVHRPRDGRQDRARRDQSHSHPLREIFLDVQLLRATNRAAKDPVRLNGLRSDVDRRPAITPYLRPNGHVFDVMLPRAFKAGDFRVNQGMVPPRRPDKAIPVASPMNVMMTTT